MPYFALMCYHYETYLTTQQILERFGIKRKQPPPAQTSLFEPMFHVSGFAFPKMPIVRNEDGEKVLNHYYWGLIPGWAKDETFAKSIRTKTLNARAETLAEKPSFRNAVKTSRCLVPATGFFEWHTRPDKKKIPHYIHLKDDKPFAFAGICEQWLNKATGELVPTYSIVTTRANPLLAHIHNSKSRMPVILPEAHEDLWLDMDLPVGEALKLLQPYEQAQMQAHTISKLITSRGVDTNVPEVKALQEWPDYALPF